ncbi:MAG: membrane protein insertion efficiency factor YidD [Acidimicrobiia bacterium]
MLRAIETYQRAFEGRPSPCRFFPTCSAYGHEAIAVHGAGRGLWLTIRRLSRCRPFGPSGVDLVPLPRHRPDAVPSAPLSSPIEEC